MPQLDFTIIFTQIFWLFFTFLLLYTVSVHYFLPLFLKSLKSRNLIILVNERESKELHDSFLETASNLTKYATKGLTIAKFFHSIEFLLDSRYNNPRTTDNLDTYLIKVLMNMMLYCDSTTLNCVTLKSKIFGTQFFN